MRYRAETGADWKYRPHFRDVYKGSEHVASLYGGARDVERRGYLIESAPRLYEVLVELLRSSGPYEKPGTALETARTLAREVLSRASRRLAEEGGA